ncbi:TetR family transcriptional regulator, partial [Enterobacter hormaechei]|nr:TetR family transcriptional regulator [Enterobacter hormaechei]
MEENTVLREDVLAEAIKILEIEGIANTSLEMVAERVSCPTSDLKRFWPDREALL